MNLSDIKKTSFSLLRPHPARDWAIVFFIALILFAVNAIYAGYLFFGMRSGAIVGTAEITVEAPPSVTREKIESVLGIYRVRKTEYENNARELPPLPDPAR